MNLFSVEPSESILASVISDGKVRTRDVSSDLSIYRTPSGKQHILSMRVKLEWALSSPSSGMWFCDCCNLLKLEFTFPSQRALTVYR